MICCTNSFALAWSLFLFSFAVSLSTKLEIVSEFCLFFRSDGCTHPTWLPLSCIFHCSVKTTIIYNIYIYIIYMYRMCTALFDCICKNRPDWRRHYLIGIGSLCLPETCVAFLIDLNKKPCVSLRFFWRWFSLYRAGIRLIQLNSWNSLTDLRLMYRCTVTMYASMYYEPTFKY